MPKYRFHYMPANSYAFILHHTMACLPTVIIP